MDKIRPVLNECHLVVGSRSFNPIETASPYRYRVVALGRTFEISDDVVKAFDDGGHQVWAWTSSPAEQVRWLGADKQAVFLAAAKEDGPDPSSVIRVALDSGKRLDDFQLNLSQARTSAEVDRFVALKVIDARILVLSRRVTKSQDSDEKVEAYTLEGYGTGLTKPAWTKHYASAGNTPDSHGMLLAAAYPNYGELRVAPLTRLENDVLVCASPIEPIRRISAGDGAQKWSLDRLWEFQRGFIGPSVWQHFVARFGEDSFTELKGAALAKLRKQFDSSYECALAAGPAEVTVPGEEDWLGRKHKSLFVAVSKGGRGSWSGYLADCFLYEIDAESGAPNTVTPLPYFLNGGQWAAQASTIVWAGQNDSLLCVKGTPTQDIGMGPGGPDASGDIVWLRRFSRPAIKAWVNTDKASSAPVFYGQMVLQVADGSYVIHKEDRECAVPLRFTETSSGEETYATLIVPLNAPMPTPDSNYNGSANSIRTRGPYGVGITRMEVVGSRLRILLGAESYTGVVEFDAKAVFDAAKQVR